MTFNKSFLNFFLLGLVIALIYCLWAVQPQSADEWRNAVSTLFQKHAWPETGNQIRYLFSGYNYLVTSPFSLFKPYSLLTAVIMTSMIWLALGSESIFTRFLFTILTLLGFPYLGHIGAWNIAASHYSIALGWLILWYFLLKRMQTNEKSGAAILLFILSFLSAVWLEVWLISFIIISAYFFIDWIVWAKGHKNNLWQKRTVIMLAIVMGTLLALWFYTKGGPEVYINQRMRGADMLPKVLNVSYLAKSLMIGIKETAVVLKDSLAIFFLIGFIKLNKDFKPRLTDPLFLGVFALGAMSFIFINTFIAGAPHWRVRFLCVIPLFWALYALPQPLFLNSLKKLNINSSAFYLARKVCLVLAVALFSYNACFTYFYNNIDVQSWLEYRELVIKRDPRALEDFALSRFPANRPRGVAFWSNEPWGAQDDRYRYFFSPSIEVIKASAQTYWRESAK